MTVESLDSSSLVFTNGIYLVGAPGVGARSTTSTATGAYSQPPAIGNLLVAVILSGSTTGQATGFKCTQASGSTFTQGSVFGNNNVSSTNVVHIEYWTRVATGGETAPVFNVLNAAPSGAIVVIFELFNPNNVPLDVSGIWGSGGSASAISSLNGLLTSSGNVAAANEFAIAAWCFTTNGTSATSTWTKGAAYTNAYFDGTVSSRTHMAVDYIASPTAGAAVTENCSITSQTQFGCGIIIVFRQGTVVYPAGQISAVGPPAIASSNGVSNLNIVPQNGTDLLVVSTKVGASSVTVTGISGTGTSGWIRVAGPFTDNQSSPHLQELWMGIATVAGATALTFTYSASVTSTLIDLSCQEFTTGYSNSTWSVDGAYGSQNNVSSTTMAWPALTAAKAGELYAGKGRIPAGGFYTNASTGFVIGRDANNNPLLYGVSVGPGSVAPSATDSAATIQSMLGVLLQWAGVVTPVAGSSAAASSASGTIGRLGSLVGSSASASSANGTVTRNAIIAGSSATASAASGTAAGLLVVAGSSSSASSANGTLGNNDIISGTSATASTASGSIVLSPVYGTAASVSAANGTVNSLLVTAGSSATASAATGAAGRFTPLAGSAANVSGANGTIVLTAVIAGASAAVSAASGAIGRDGPLTGSSSAASSAAGAIAALLAVAGSSVTASAASGSLSKASPVAGSSASVSSANGAVTTEAGAITWPVSGSAPAVSSATGTLSLNGVVVGTSTATATASGAVARLFAVSGSSATPSSASGSFSEEGAIAGSATATSAASGAVDMLIPVTAISGLSATASAATGSVSMTGEAVGSSLTASSASGSLASVLGLSGLATATSAASGSLSADGSVSGSASSASFAGGTVASVLAVAGLSITVSGADGAVLPPFLPGTMPDEVTAVVVVEPGPSVTISLDSVGATVTMDTITAAVTVDVMTGSVTTDQLSAEVTA